MSSGKDEWSIIPLNNINNVIFVPLGSTKYYSLAIGSRLSYSSLDLYEHHFSLRIISLDGGIYSSYIIFTSHIDKYILVLYLYLLGKHVCDGRIGIWKGCMKISLSYRIIGGGQGGSSYGRDCANGKSLI